MRLPFFNGTGQRPSRSSPFVVYTMASDAMLAYAAVFFESFRRYNPTLPLWVIPYDTCDKIAPLAKRYGARMVKRDFRDFDAWAATLFDRPIFYGLIDISRRLRKFAAFESAASEFMYIDLDSIVLSSLDPLFGFVASGQAQLLYTLGGGDWVYNSHGATEPPPGERFADGLFVTSSLYLNLAQIRRTVAEDEALYKAVRRAELISQPLLNFVCHRRGMRLVSAGKLGVAAIDVNIGETETASMARTVDGDIRTGEGQAILRAHWAGPDKYRGQIAHRDLVDEFIADAIKSGRLLEREAAALSFSIGA